jgi:hypothetical protein
MVKETTVRKGFLTDAQYQTLRDELPKELKSLFVCAYITGSAKPKMRSQSSEHLGFSLSRCIAVQRDDVSENSNRGDRK